MATNSGRSTLASIVGWIIVALLIYWLLGAIFASIFFLFRFVMWIVLLGVLLWAYFALKGSDDD